MGSGMDAKCKTLHTCPGDRVSLQLFRWRLDNEAAIINQFIISDNSTSSHLLLVHFSAVQLWRERIMNGTASFLCVCVSFITEKA